VSREGTGCSVRKIRAPLHIVFSTKHREPFITPQLAERLYPFIGGVIGDEKGTLFDSA